MSLSSKSEDSESNEPGDTYRLSQESPLAPEGIRPPPPVNFKKNARPKSTKGGTLIGFNALVFVTSVCVMTLELTASRLIGKHVGSSLYTWTSVIGVVLSGITLGNWLGGWLADRFDRSRSLAWMYLLGSVSCGSVLWLDQLVGTIPRPESFSWPAWVVTVVAVIFLLPALALGATSPLVASMALERSHKTGATVGNVYAWGALGSIVGTFLTGFYFVDELGTRSIVGMTAATLAVLAVLVAGGRRVFRTAVVLGWLQLLGWTMVAATANSELFASVGGVVADVLSVGQSNVDALAARESWTSFGSRIGTKFHEVGLIAKLRDDHLGEYHDESNYSNICVSETTIDGRTVKALRLDKLIHSYYDARDPTRLHYEYEKVYAAVTKKVAQPTSTEPMTLTIDGLSGVTLTPENLPSGVTLNEDKQNLVLEQPSNDVLSQLLAVAPEAKYWSAIEYLFRETTKPNWGGFSSVNLPQLPEGIVIPDDIGEKIRHDETLGVLIAYQPLTAEMRDRLIANTQSAAWYNNVTTMRKRLRQASACFYGGGGFIFPRWFLQEFPGAPRIDVAELDPAVYKVAKSQLGLTKDLEQQIHTIIGDARNFVDDRLRENVSRKSRSEQPILYDFIYADAFNDFSIPWHLTTREFLQKTHDLLSERGVFQANIIDIYPRTEFPGTSVGHAEAEYSGRLPERIMAEEVRRDKAVPAAPKFAPLEVIELLTNRFSLRVTQTLGSKEQDRLHDVKWPEVKAPTKLDADKGFQPEIDVTQERSSWHQAIDNLALRSRAKIPFQGTIPDALNVSGGVLEGWVAAKPPFEFVEAYRIGGDSHILGFRGVISSSAEETLQNLDPQNAEWVNAVKTAARKSRLPGAGRFLGRYVASAARVFPNIYLFSTSHQQPHENRDTFVMVCARQPLDLKSLDDTGDWTGGPFASLETLPGQSESILSGQMSAVIGLAEGQILTDDFAPVDNLLVPVFDTPE